MKNPNKMFYLHPAGYALAAAMLMSLTGCEVFFRDTQGIARARMTNTIVFIDQDDYVYYPAYGVYYSHRRNQYAYLQGGAWVSRPQPPGIPVYVLRASPSVRMDFHDSPINHHTETARNYPHNWKPAAGAHGQKENQPAGKREEHDRK